MQTRFNQFVPDLSTKTDTTSTAGSTNLITSDAVRTAINNAISGVIHEIRVVTTLPATGESGVIYLVNEAESTQSSNGDGWVEMVQGDVSELPSGRSAAVTTETVENGTLYTLSLTGYDNLRYSVKWQGSLFGTWVDVRYNTMTHLLAHALKSLATYSAMKQAENYDNNSYAQRPTGNSMGSSYMNGMSNNMGGMSSMNNMGGMSNMGASYGMRGGSMDMSGHYPMNYPMYPEERRW